MTLHNHECMHECLCMHVYKSVCVHVCLYMDVSMSMCLYKVNVSMGMGVCAYEVIRRGVSERIFVCVRCLWMGV